MYSFFSIFLNLDIIRLFNDDYSKCQKLFKLIQVLDVKLLVTIIFLSSVFLISSSGAVQAAIIIGIFGIMIKGITCFTFYVLCRDPQLKWDLRWKLKILYSLFSLMDTVARMISQYHFITTRNNCLLVCMKIGYCAHVNTNVIICMMAFPDEMNLL